MNVISVLKSNRLTLKRQILIILVIVIVATISFFAYVMNNVIAIDNVVVRRNNKALQSIANGLMDGITKSQVHELYKSAQTGHLSLVDNYEHEWIIRGSSNLVYACDRLYIYFHDDVVHSNYLAMGYTRSKHERSVRVHRTKSPQTSNEMNDVNP